MYSKILLNEIAAGISAARYDLKRGIDAALIFGANAAGTAAAAEMKRNGVERIMIADRAASKLSIAKNAGFCVCATENNNACDAIHRFFAKIPSPNAVYIEQEGAERLLQIWQQIQNTFSAVIVSSQYDKTARSCADRSVFWLHYIRVPASIANADISAAKMLIEDEHCIFKHFAEFSDFNNSETIPKHSHNNQPL